MLCVVEYLMFVLRVILSFTAAWAFDVVHFMCACVSAILCVCVCMCVFMLSRVTNNPKHMCVCVSAHSAAAAALF